MLSHRRNLICHVVAWASYLSWGLWARNYLIIFVCELLSSCCTGFNILVFTDDCRSSGYTTLQRVRVSGWARGVCEGERVTWSVSRGLRLPCSRIAWFLNQTLTSRKTRTRNPATMISPSLCPTLSLLLKKNLLSFTHHIVFGDAHVTNEMSRVYFKEPVFVCVYYFCAAL